MATVHLRISPLSRKIILSESGGIEPVTPGRADWLSDCLRIDRSDTGFSPAAQAVLRTSLLLDVPPALADRITSGGDRIGMVLHRLHIEMLTRYMLSAAALGKEAKAAMRAFYDLYDLDDDDLDEQSLYREYSRFRKTFFEKITAKSGTKSPLVVQPDSRLWQGVSAASRRISNAALDALCAHLDERLRDCRIRRLARLSRQARIYIYCIRGRRSPRKVAERFGIGKSSAYRALRAVRNRMRDNKQFAAAILPLLDESFVLPAPDEAGHLCTITASSTGSFPTVVTAITPKNREPVAAAAI